MGRGESVQSSWTTLCWVAMGRLRVRSRHRETAARGFDGAHVGSVHDRFGSSYWIGRQRVGLYGGQDDVRRSAAWVREEFDMTMHSMWRRWRIVLRQVGVLLVLIVVVVVLLLLLLVMGMMAFRRVTVKAVHRRTRF